MPSVHSTTGASTPPATAPATGASAVSGTSGSSSSSASPSTGETPLGPLTAPPPGNTTTSGVGRSTTSSSAAASFESKAFGREPRLTGILAKTQPALKKGAPKSSATQTVQTALYSLGFLPTTRDIDSSFGPKTESAIKAFQTSKGLQPDGVCGPLTLRALDTASMAKIAALKATQIPAGTKRTQFTIVADIANTSKCRVYALDAAGQVAARYLTSPGTAAHPTKSNSLQITEVLPRRSWIPPNSDWAQGLSPIGPGITNPMGILKLNFGQYAEYFHGIPASEEPELGHAASHGCLRMSGANILEFHENYAEAGSSVTVNRNATRSAQLEAAFQASGLEDRPKTAGQEFMFGYVSGELGVYQKKA